MLEVWKTIPNYHGQYEASSIGRIRSLDRLDRIGRRVQGRVLTSVRPNPRGYLVVRLCKNGKLTVFPIHRLVLEAFIGNRPLGYACCHGDGNKANNRIENLRWDTSQANVNDMVLHETVARGTRNGSSKLTEAKVREIRTRSLAGERPTVLGREFGVDRNTVRRICKRRAWAWLD